MTRQQKLWCMGGAAVVATFGLVLYFNHWMTDRWADQSLQYARTLLTVGDAQGAYDTVRQILDRRPQLSEAAMLGAHASVQLRKLDDAIQFVDHFLEYADEGRDEAWGFRGTILFELRKLGEAEESFQEALKINPKNLYATSQLCLVRVIEGRRRQSLPLRFAILRDHQGALDEGQLMETLIMLGNPQAIVAAQEILEAALVAEPDDPLPHLGLGRLALKQNRLEAAERHFRAIVEAMPQQAEAQARLGQVYLARPEAEREKALLDWKRSLPESVAEHAEIWVVQGLWAQQRREWDVAVRCFWEAVKRDPNHALACYQLAVSLTAAGDPSMAPPFQARARRLQELALLCDQLHESGGTLVTRARNAELCEQLGRYWEAEAWTRLVLMHPLQPDPERSPEDRLAQLQEDEKAHAKAKAIRSRIADKITPELPQVAPDHRLAQRTDLSQFPLPDFSVPVETEHHLAAADLTRLPRFEEVTKQAGIDFQYHNGDDPQTEGRRMFEFTGGGVASIDYDQDGWPDLYFTQGCDWPPDPNQTRYRDRLYRNLGNGRFVDVTLQVGLGDRGFSQGVAVGDYDNDGWPDLLVCNVGRNRLYRNNGDGTFREVADGAGLRAEVWSTSAAIADLNLDGTPDIYQVNYLKGGRAFELICAREGKARSCSPTEFEAEQDQLFLGEGNGKFRDVTRQAGIVAPQGKGLGCVVADFDGSGQLSIFVANDTTANFLFRPQRSPSGPLNYVEQAGLLGTAFDREGKAQACMGIAVDDSDGDGRLDLFITNFYNEANAFYHQQEGGSFLDESSGWGLSAGSLKLLGFGTQFFDAELDGLPDLIITNGHVDDFRYTGEPFQMPPQYYRNLGGRFAEWPVGDLGPFFQRNMLGRGLALIDYDRDGREDFAVSHLDVPVALVANRSENAGHYLAVQLVGRHAARDAVGAWVVVHCGNTTRTRQLTGGGGYHASNQRQLVFGLGGHESVDRLEVRWPGGESATWTDLPVDREIRVIEGGGWYEMPRETAD